MMDLCELTAVDAAALIARREISPVELTASLLQRIDKLDPHIQAWETVDRDGAMAVARQREAELARGKGAIGPLHGVPFGIKDIIAVAGLPNTAGFSPFAKFVPREDAAAVSRLRQAGAIILGKTVTTQFAHADPPRTRNPWNPDRTPGGSSSGSAAAVAARLAPAALGTQTGGSVLRPAAYCGCVGFKPTFDRIDRQGVFPLAWSLDHIGVIARSVADAALLFACLADTWGRGDRGRGTDSQPLTPVPPPLSSPPRLGLLMDFLEHAAPAVRDHLLDVARRLESEGAEVVEARLPVDLSLILAIHQVIMSTEASAVHAALLGHHAGSYGPVFRSYLEVGQLVPGAAYVQARRLRRKLRRQVEEFMTEFDCLILPTASNVAPDPSTTGNSSFQAPWSLFGLPAISLPTGLSEEGLPLATQLVAARNGEDALFPMAAWCEAILGTMPCPL